MSGSVNRKSFGFWIASYYQIGPVFRKLLDVDIKSSSICNHQLTHNFLRAILKIIPKYPTLYFEILP
jgi:hypothetical protein